MLGKGWFAIVKKWKWGNGPHGDGIAVIEYCETIEEGEEYIRHQKKSPDYDWVVMKYI